MSYINNALRKVQKERDNRYGPYGDIISSPQKRPEPARRRFFLVYAAAGIALIIISSLIAYSYRDAAKGQIKSAAAVPRAAASAPQTAVSAKPQGGDEWRLLRAAQLYEEALAAQRGKRWEEAGSFYRQALTFDPRHINSLNNLGVLSMSQGRHEDAVELFVKAIAAKEDYVDPYYNLACLYSQTGNVKASLVYLARAIKIDGKVREWAHSDADFKKMRLLPEFKKITEE
jgi:tetratricopeptide (TPR) repeat protein